MPTAQVEKYISRLTKARERLNDVLDAAQPYSDEQLYSDGAQWTVRQLAIHLAIADKGHNKMLEYISRGENLIPEDYDLNRYNKRSVEKSDDMTFEQARQSLAQSRQELLEWLENIDDATLEKEGRHASLHILTIAQIMNVMSRHEEGHASDLEAFVQSKQETA